MARLSLHCNGATVSLPPPGFLPTEIPNSPEIGSNGIEKHDHSFVRVNDMTEFRKKGAEYEENFIDGQFIISVVGKSHLLIRHGLGIAVFEVEDLSKREEISPIIELPHVEKMPPPPAQTEIYHSQIEADEESDKEMMEALELDQQFVAHETLKPYQEPKRTPCVSDAHAALCDLGFIGSAAHDRVRTITSDSKLAFLDSLPPVTYFEIPVLQITKEGEIGSYKTPLLPKLLDLLAIQSPVPNLPCSSHSPPNRAHIFKSAIADICFTSPVLEGPSTIHNQNTQNSPNSQNIHTQANSGSNSPERSSKERKNTDMIVLLNEMGMPFLSYKTKKENYGLIVGVSPMQGGKYFVIDLLFRGPLYEPFNQVFSSQPEYVHFACPSEQIGKLIVMVALLYFAAIPDGAFQFSNGFSQRADQIKYLYENANQGRTSLLTGALTCGQPHFV